MSDSMMFYSRLRPLTVISVLLLCIGMASPLYMPVAAYTWQDPVDAPVWITGDQWKYWTISRETITQTQSSPGLYTLYVDQKYLSDNTTYTTGAGTIVTNGYTTFKQTVSGQAVFSGTYQYVDLLGLGMDESGCFSGTATNNGQQWRRVSDLAFVKASLTVQESVTFYTDCGGTVSGLLGSQNGQGSSVSEASPPLNDLMYPLTAGLEWDTQSTVTVTTTPQGGQASQVTTSYDFHNKVNGTMDHTVDAGTFKSFEIYESGTKDRDGNIQPVEQSAYYSPDVKNFIDKTQDMEKLTSFNVKFYADLNITQYNISVDPATPVQGLAATVNATIWNRGHEDANNFKAELWVGPTKIETVDVTSIKTGQSDNVSFQWTPSTAGDNTVKVIVDTTTAITEYSETNNQAQITVISTTPRPDLVIQASDITAPTEVPIETLQTIKAKVHNNGNQIASNVLVRFFDGSTQIGGDQTFTSIDQGADIEASVVWEANGVGGHTIRAKADPNSAITELNENNNEASIAVNVVQLNYSFSMSAPVTFREVKPTEPAQFQITVKNTGKKQDTVNFIVSPPPTDWIASVDKPSIQLASGSTQPIILTVTPPVGVAAGTDVNLTVAGTSQGDTNYKQLASFETKVKQVAGAKSELKTTSQDMSGKPGETVSYEFAVQNTGNAADTFELSVDAQKPWTTTIEGPTSTGELLPGATKTVTVKTTIPDGTAADDNNAITFTAKSAFDPLYKKEAMVTLTCEQVFDLSAAVTPPTQDVDPGESATFTLKITNDGNGDDQVNISIKGSPEIPTDWTLTFDEKSTIKAGKDKDLLITIEVPKTTLAKDYTLTIEVQGLSGDKIQKPVSLGINQVFDLEISVLPTTAQVKAGKSVMFTVTVKNLGNGEDTVDLTTVNLDTKVTAIFSDSQIKLAAGETKDVTLTLTTKSSAKGAKTVEVKATSKEGKISESTNIALSVKALEQANNNMMLYILILVIIIGVVAVVAVIMMKRKK